MKKIGTTSTGGVIVEMTAQEFQAIQQLRTGVSAAANVVAPAVSKKMNHAERVSYVAERLKKLKPKKRSSVVRSIETMFQFTEKIDSPEAEKIVGTLQKQKFFRIFPDGNVKYGASS